MHNILNKETLKDNIRLYCNISTITILFLLLLRIFEALILFLSGNYDIQACFFSNLKGWGFDIVYYAKCSLIIFPLFYIGSLINKNLSFNILRIIFTSILFLSCCLIIYFSIAGVPLDSVIFVYSFSEILEIIASSQNAPLWEYLIIILIGFLFFTFSKRIIITNTTIASAILLLLLCSGFIRRPQINQFSKLETYYICENKTAFIIKSIKNHLAWKNEETYNSQKIKDLENILYKKFTNQHFTDNNYPFLHTDSTPDILSKFFILNDELPNIVIIICEGLGREFSGYNSIVPSATPFLDSLSNVGLTWNNCLSTSQRTICALPSILGALPFGKTGFMNYRENAPKFHSLYTILNKNNYTSSFFYGGWLCFDDMCHFMKMNNVDNYLNCSEFDTCLSKRNSWGLYDHILFQESVKTIDFEKTHMDVYLTLTTHDPFEYPNEEKYIDTYKDLLTKNNVTIGEEQIRKYAAYLYLDNSIRTLIELYKKNKNFNNTIFVITGDHNFNTWKEPMVCYNVPLIIWSPLLKHSQKFPAIVSHRDIAPTLISMLKHKYSIKSPEEIAWLNSGLDTSHTFKGSSFSPMMDVGRNICRCLYNDYFYQDDQLYKITYENDILDIKKIQDTINFKLFFEAYKELDLYVTENDALIRSNDKKYCQEILFNIDNEIAGCNYLSKKTNTQPQLFSNRNSIFFQKKEFPFSLCKLTVEKEDAYYQVVPSFDIYITNKDDKPYDYIQLVTEISRNNQQIYWASEQINGYWMDKNKYDTWYTFKSKNTLRKENYKLEDGDIISFYLWNPSKRDFYISNFQLNVQKFKK